MLVPSQEFRERGYGCKGEKGGREAASLQVRLSGPFCLLPLCLETN